jgi:hypothetical protein
MPSVSIHRAYSPVEVDLWHENGGGLFETVDLPRSKLKCVNEIEAEIAEIEATPDALDELIEKLGEMFDLKLMPIDGRRKKPSTIIKAKWKTDDMTINQLRSFAATVQLKEAEGGRPT